jgi:iron complex outermembrane receptor protein
MTHAFNERSMLNVKGSYTHFQRRIEIPGYAFEGLQQSGFAELNYNWRGEKLDWILGMNLLTDRFDEEPLTPGLLRDYSFNTVGFFVQNQWSPGEVFTLETGLRVDKVNAYGFSFLPRVSAMFRLSDRFTIRAGGGLGYKTPTVFNEEAERIQFRNILPIDPSITENEQSTGANVDLNYRTRLGDLGVSLNQLFFYTRLDRPLVLTENGSRLEFVNANGYMDTKGMETNIRLSYADFKLFIGYTYADVNTHFDGQSEWFPLTARHRLNNVLMYEKDEKWKVGFEAYYFSPQRLNDGATGRSYWILGLMAERAWERFALFVNFENFTDSRQTKFDTIYTGTIDDPTFRGIYAPLEGFIVNGGFKLRL